MANTSLYVLSPIDGLPTTSPKFLTVISSPSSMREISSTSSNSEITPVIRKSTLFVKSPFSYPKIVSSDLISDAIDIVLVIPVQPKN